MNKLIIHNNFICNKLSENPEQEVKQSFTLKKKKIKKKTKLQGNKCN